MFKNNERNVFVVAHPDDELFGVGGTIIRTAQEFNDKNTLIVCTDTAPDEYSEYYENRVKSLIKLLDNEFKDFIDEYFIINGETFNIDHFILSFRLKKILSKYEKINNVITHNHDDFNQDHRKVHDAVFLLFRPNNMNCDKFITFEIYDSTNTYYSNFNPNLYFNINEKQFELKLNLLKKYYPSELKNCRTESDIKTLMTSRGIFAGKKYCEAMTLVRGVI